MKFTENQQYAIDLDQHNILVNAAAGSGKTAVLVERLFQRLIAGATLDAFIVITFTKLAASEMKERLAKRIHDELAKLEETNPLYAHLTYVESQVPTSHISTIDAFCSFIVREYGYTRPEIKRKLTLIDTVEMEKIDQEAFIELADVILTEPLYFNVAEKYIDIKNLENQQLLSLFLTIVPEFSNVANHQRRYGQLLMSCKPITNIEELPLFATFLTRQHEIVTALDTDALNQFAYHPKYEEDMKKLTALISGLQSLFATQKTYRALHEAISDFTVHRKPAVAKDEVDAESEALYQEARKGLKAQIDAVCNLFKSEPESEVAIINAARQEMQICIDMAYQFYVKAQQLRLERGRVVFLDISQLAYQILNEETMKNMWREQITEIMIDEYQDTTLAQEELFATFGADKLFLVGDMKQAIYRFRQSDPLLFATKNNTYREQNNNTVIDLNKNFRSRSQVLTYINDLFEPLMDETVGEMQYDDNAKLYFGLDAYRGDDHKVDVLLVDATVDETINHDELQAEVITREIMQVMRDGMEVFDKGEMRPIKYSDIAILTRNNQSRFLDLLLEKLQEAGIPFAKEGKTKFQAYLEVTWIVALLQVLDNPFDDILFATVLKSPIGKVSMQELYTLAQNEGQTLYEKARRASTPAVTAFFARFDDLRQQLFMISPTQFFRQMLQTFQIEKVIEAMSNRTLRKQNIEIMYELTKELEKNGRINFPTYVNYFVRQIEQDQITLNAPMLSESEDAIIIQTFHKSKGLEYPVVFVANTQKQFNLIADESLYKLKENGIVRANYQDAEQKKYQTFESLLFKDQIRHESLSEEMRLFYVALTRAREKLYITGVVKEKQKALILPKHQQKIAYQKRIGATSMLDWVMLSLTNTDAHIDVRFFEKFAETASFNVPKRPHEEAVPALLSEEAQHSLAWIDPKKGYQQIPLKLSVTELKKQATVEINDDQFVPLVSNDDVIKPHLQTKRIGSAEIGTATHTLFEHFDFTRTTPEDIELQLSQLVKKKQIAKEVAEKIECDDIYHILQGPIGQLLQQAPLLKREVPFRMMVDARLAGYQDVEAEILVQGVIDALVIDQQQKTIQIIDYKTDNMNRYQTAEAKRFQMQSRYQVQAALYKEAIERIYPDCDVVMYFVTLSDGIIYTYQNEVFTI